MQATVRVLARMQAIFEERKGQIDIFCLPELSPVGYSEDTFANYLPKTRELQALYQQIDVIIADAARKMSVYIAYGTVGWKNGAPANMFFIRHKVANQTGDIVASYDKIHLCDYGNCAETCFFTSGATHVQDASFVCHGLTFGLLICADMRYPAWCQRLVAGGAHVLLQPAAFGRDCSFWTWKSFCETRAVENSVYFCGVNYAGDYYGQTCLVPPWVDQEHEALVLGTEEGFLLGTLDPAVLNRVRTRMPFYRHLMAMKDGAAECCDPAAS